MTTAATLLLLALHPCNSAFTTETSKAYPISPLGLTPGSPSFTPPQNIAPETTKDQLSTVEHLLFELYGQRDSKEYRNRRLEAQSSSLVAPRHELVYGELGIASLVKILDAVGVRKGDEFLDIGAGHGMLVLAASLLFPWHIGASRGVEIVPHLWEQSQLYLHQLKEEGEQCPCTELLLGDIYHPDARLEEILHRTTLAVCFATTWSRDGKPGRDLPKLSRALRKGVLAPNARIVVIDGRLMPEDGHEYRGELRLDCPDTAPYSTAYLYTCS